VVVPGDGKPSSLPNGDNCSTMPEGMIGFRVVLNGNQLVTAGLAGHHVLSAILSSVVRDPARKTSWPAGRAFLERELEFSVSGLDSDREQHVGWLSRELTVGDRIEIQILDADEFDAPVSGRPKRASPERVVEAKSARKTSKKSVGGRSAPPGKSSASMARKAKTRRKK